MATSVQAELGDKNSLLIQDTSWEGYEDIPLCIIQGYSTLFVEIEMQLKEQALPGITHCIVPVGVGSLAHSVVQYYHSQAYSADVSVITVEPVTAACLNASLHRGERTSIHTSTTIMQGLNCGTVSYTAWPDLKAGVEVSVTVEDDQVRLSMGELSTLGINAGACGAATLTALKKLQNPLTMAASLDKDAVILLLITEQNVILD